MEEIETNEYAEIPLETEKLNSIKEELEKTKERLIQEHPEWEEVVNKIYSSFNKEEEKNYSVSVLAEKLFSNSNQNMQGVYNLIDRISKVPKNFPVEDLLFFLSTGNFPIADNGDVLAYKYLERDEDSGLWHDWYSKKVIQGPGYIVSMPAASVDNNRDAHCSYGLHIATQGYLESFASSEGDTFIVKFNPEDVISVPTDTSTKIRVSSYMILFRLPHGDQKNINAGKPVSMQYSMDCLEKAMHMEYPNPSWHIKLKGRTQEYEKLPLQNTEAEWLSIDAYTPEKDEETDKSLLIGSISLEALNKCPIEALFNGAKKVDIKKLAKKLKKLSKKNKKK